MEKDLKKTRIKLKLRNRRIKDLLHIKNLWMYEEGGGLMIMGEIEAIGGRVAVHIVDISISAIRSYVKRLDKKENS